jgi:hypothetical protein
VNKRGLGAMLWLGLGMPLFGQVSEASLRALYGKPVNGSYVVRPGVTIDTSDGGKREVCVLTVTGPATEHAVMDVVDQAVPAASRGLALRSMLECVGDCVSNRIYEKATIVTAVMAGQTATPAAIVTFKGKSCEQRVKEAGAKGFSITRSATAR